MKWDEVVATYFPLIDEELAAQEVNVRLRPFRAAVIFVEEYVVKVSHDDKTDFATKPWFAVIYHHFEKWYREHYGPVFDEDRSRSAVGVVLVRELPVELRVPLTRTRVETPGETAWFMFPIEVESDEDSLTWLVSPPALDRLPPEESDKLTAQTTKIATALRAVRMNLMGVEPSDEEVAGMLEGVLADFEAGARNILRDDTSGRGAAIWSLQMAVERTLKAYAKHKNGSYRTVHNLFLLFDDVAQHLFGIDRELLKQLPRDKQAITDRYGLGGTPSLPELMGAYNAALELVAGVSRLFKRKFSVGGGGFLIQKPPWLTLPDANKKTPER